MKVVRVLFLLLLLLFSIIEAIWFNFDSDKRQKLLGIIGSGKLVDVIQSEHYYPLLPQIYQLRLNNNPQILQKSARTDNEPLDQHSETHSKMNEASCEKPKAQDLNNTNQQKIYKWVDDDGRTHFGEKTNVENENRAENLSKQYEGNRKPVDFTIRYPGWQGDSIIESDIKRQTRIVFKILSQFIPRAYQRKINIKIVIFENYQKYNVHRKIHKNRPRSIAYYNSTENTIFLPYYSNNHRMMAMVRHEISHAIIAGMLGSVPVWINEGLAEYMETFTWQLNWIEAEPSSERYGHLGEMKMKFLENIDRLNSYGIDSDRSYLEAQARIFFLLDHQMGRNWLRSSFEMYGKNPCAKVSTKQLFEDYYPGGAQEVSRNFSAWLNKGEYRSHRY